jgi:hypothetical protein
MLACASKTIRLIEKRINGKGTPAHHAGRIDTTGHTGHTRKVLTFVRIKETIEEVMAILDAEGAYTCGKFLTLPRLQGAHGTHHSINRRILQLLENQRVEGALNEIRQHDLGLIVYVWVLS